MSAGGWVAPGFEPVAELLSQGRSVTVRDKARPVDLGSGGGAFAAYVQGECVVDVWAGWARPGVPWEEDTRAVIMSATKGLSALCAHLLIDRGAIDMDARVTDYWPEFAAAGKEATLVRQLLSHQSGAIGVPAASELLSWDGDGWSDAAGIAESIAASSPAWQPGTRHGYHGLTFGWLVGELIRRVTGNSLGAFFADEVAGPLELDASIGTGPDVLPRVAEVMEWSVPAGSASSLTTIDPESRTGRSVLAGPHGHLFADEHGVPRFADFMNRPAVLAAEIGAINATATARALARLYAGLAAGEELVARRSVGIVSEEQVCGRDAVMGLPTRWAVGYSRESPALVPGLPRQHGPNDEAFGHMGAGGQIGFADPVGGIGCGFVRNHLENQSMPLMGASLVGALYECVEKERSHVRR